jgi:hypothetical protein
MKCDLFYAGVLFVALAAVASTNCKSSTPSTPSVPAKGVFTIEASSAVGGYSKSKKKYMLSFLVKVTNTNSVGGNINSWTFLVKRGATVVSEITESNFASLGFTSRGNSRIDPNGTGTIDILQNEWHSLTSTPDKIEVAVVVTDDNNNSQTLTAERSIIMATFP